MSAAPKITDNPLYQLLRDDNVKEFNEKRPEAIDFSGLDFRGLDLRGINAKGINFNDAYFHQTDLRGLDLSECSMLGASVNMASISGCYFPHEISADEIRLSNTTGTRMRQR